MRPARALEDRLLSTLSSAGSADPARAALPALASAALTSDDLLSLVHASLDDDKAEDVVAVDLRGKTSVADHMVIATGRSTRQVAAIADKLIQRIKATTGSAPRAEGLEAADWVLVDAGDVIVHIFRPEVREFYQLEKLWLPAGEAGRRVGGSA